MDASDKKTDILVVCGPTATGKTDLAFALCRRFGGELIGADSMQVYEGLTVGTAAPLATEYPDIKRHLIGCLPPSVPFSVADYVRLAGEAIGEVAAGGGLPVVCGGTGLYIDSLVNGISFTDNKIDVSIVAKLEVDWEEQGAGAMLQRLGKVDGEAAARLHPNDKKRILRALAEGEACGTTLAGRNAASRQNGSPYRAKVLGLWYDDREALYRKIEERVDRMVEDGLVAEARRVYERRESYKTAVQAIGYKEFFPHFEGREMLDECVARLKRATRRYAKRQLTWFKHRDYVQWLAVDGEDVGQRAFDLTAAFLRESDSFHCPPLAGQ